MKPPQYKQKKIQGIMNKIHDTVSYIISLMKECADYQNQRASIQTQLTVSGSRVQVVKSNYGAYKRGSTSTEARPETRGSYKSDAHVLKATQGDKNWCDAIIQVKKSDSKVKEPEVETKLLNLFEQNHKAIGEWVTVQAEKQTELETLLDAMD